MDRRCGVIIISFTYLFFTTFSDGSIIGFSVPRGHRGSTLLRIVLLAVSRFFFSHFFGRTSARAFSHLEYFPSSGAPATSSRIKLSSDKHSE